MLPVFVVGVVGLAVTIIGIPLLLVYVPLFIVAVLGAAAVGLVTVAHALGERTAEQRGSYETRHRNAYSYVFTGLALLLAPLVVANLLGMTGFLGFVGDLVGVFAGVLLWAATSVGIGAVLMGANRTWRERRYRRMMGLGGHGRRRPNPGARMRPDRRSLAPLVLAAALLGAAAPARGQEWRNVTSARQLQGERSAERGRWSTAAATCGCTPRPAACSTACRCATTSGRCAR